MIAFLYDAPDLGVAMLFGGVTALLFAVAPLVRMRLVGPVNQVNCEIARTTMVTVTSFTGAVLAFSLVQAQTNLRSVEKTVATEATQLNQMDRLLIRWGDPKVATIRVELHEYTASIVVDEWPQLSAHSSSARTAELFATLSRAVFALQPAPGRESVIYADLLKLADELAESREERLNATDLGLPPVYWEVISALTILLIGFAAFAEPRRGRMLALGGLGAGLGLLISLVFLFDQPFLGNVSVAPDAISKTLQIMQARTS